MKKILLAALAAVFVVTGFNDAWAQARLQETPLVFVRNSSGSDNPNPGSAMFAQYKIGIANGNHPAAGLGVAVAPQDTTDAIDIRNHALKSYSWNKTAAALSPNDSTALGTLFLYSNSGTIDSIFVFMDRSQDGITWTQSDSIGGHIMSDVAQIATGAVSDSARFVMGAVANATGNVSRGIGLGFTCIPQVGKAGVTAQAFIDVNFIRFRIHMTPGDFAAAGANGGIVGKFSYLANAVPSP